MKKSSKSSLTTQYIILFGVLMLMANILLGYLLLRQSSLMIQSLLRKSMLNISNTAAALVDGDVIGSLTKEDVGSPEYNKILENLAAFQNNVDIEFIYAVRQVGDNEFIFTVDPDPVDPGQFGEDVLVTDALRQAGMGIATVDNESAEDRWGNFYSSYSPVFDSKGKVAGIIGVDFNEEWYNGQVWKNTYFVILFSILFTLVGAAAFLFISGRMRRRFDALNAELAVLSNDVEELTEELLSSAGYKDEKNWEDCSGRKDGEPGDEGDELRTLSCKIHSMHKEMERYLNYMHAQVNTDALTRVGNTTAYMERQKELEAKILDGSASFFAVVFDINDLKNINDNYGHVCGDRVIRAAAAFIAAHFGVKNTFRIGGDEFIAIAEKTDPQKLEKLLAGIDGSIEAYNRGCPPQEAKLSLSRGYSDFIPERDHSFRDVFIRADGQMYDTKDSFHRRNRTES